MVLKFHRLAFSPGGLTIKNMSARKSRPKEKAVTHVRRCHVCGTVIEAKSAVILNCIGCGKHLAPYYYFDESKCDGVAEDGLHWSAFKSASEFNPIWGLSTYWSTEDSDKEIYESVTQRPKGSPRKA